MKWKIVKNLLNKGHFRQKIFPAPHKTNSEQISVGTEAGLWQSFGCCVWHMVKRTANVDLHLGGVLVWSFLTLCVYSVKKVSIAAQYTAFDSFLFSFLGDCSTYAFLSQYIRYSSLLSCYFSSGNQQKGLTIDALMCDSLKILTLLLA